MSRTKWISSPAAVPASTARWRRLAGATTTSATVATRCVTDRCYGFPNPRYGGM